MQSLVAHDPVNAEWKRDLGVAHLSVAVQLIALNRPTEALASILGPAMFQWGAAAEHIKSILATGNMAPGNAGIMLYSDVFLPLIGFALLWFKRSADTSCAASGMVSGTVRG